MLKRTWKTLTQLPLILVGKQTGAVTLENSLAVSQEVKHSPTV